MVKLYYEDEKVKIFHGDFLELKLDDEDLPNVIITSPPYNVDMPYDEYNDFMPYPVYLNKVRRWMVKMRRLLKTDGRLIINIPFAIYKGERIPVVADYCRIGKEVGLKFHTIIVWDKGAVLKNNFGSMDAQNPFCVQRTEAILVFYKNSWKREGKSFIRKDRYLKLTEGYWQIPGPKQNLGHPAPFSEKLVEAIIELFVLEGDVVMDPFMGTGTTLVVAKRYGLKAIGIDISERYCWTAKRRCERVQGVQQKLPDIFASSESRIEGDVKNEKKKEVKGWWISI